MNNWVTSKVIFWEFLKNVGPSRDFQILLRPNTFFSPITDIQSLIRPPKKGVALKLKAGNAIKTRMEFVISDFEFAKK